MCTAHRFCVALSSISLFILYSHDSYSQVIQDSFILEDLYIKANRYDSDDPVSISLLESEKIRAEHYGQNPVFLLERTVPSLQVEADGGSPYGNYAQFRLRGIVQERINFTLDGVPLNDMMDHGTFFSNISDITANVSSIQVLRGVGVSAHGVPSFGGAVDMEGINPLDDRHRSVIALQLASFNSLRASAQISAQNEDGDEGIYARFSHLRSDGYIDHSESEAYSGYMAAAKKWKKGILKATALIGKTQNQQAYLAVPLDVVRESPKTNGNHPNDRDDFVQGLATLSYDHQFHNNLRWRNTVYYGMADGYFPFSISDTTQFNFGVKNERVGLISQVLGEVKGIEYKTGIHGYLFNRENRDWLGPNVSNPFDIQESKKNELAAFLSVQKRWSRWAAHSTAQLRTLTIEFDESPEFGTGIDHQRNHTFINVLVGLDYSIDAESQLYLSYGISNREPTRADIFQGDPMTIRNNSLKAEQLHDMELGYRYKSEALAFSFNAFYMQFNNEIVSLGARQENTFFDQTQNAQRSQRYGIEFSASAKISTRLKANLVGTIMDSNIESITIEENTISNATHVLTPQFNTTPSLEYEILENLSVQLGARIWSDSFTELSNSQDFVLPGAFVLNGVVRYIPSPSWECALRLNNIANKEYYTDGEVLEDGGNIQGFGVNIQAPFNVALGVQKFF